MDEFIKRLGIAYCGFTAALWSISLAMAMNGSNHPANPAWQLVSSLRLLFTAGLLLPLLLVALFFGITALAAGKEEARRLAEENEREAALRVKIESTRREAERIRAAREEAANTRLRREALEREAAERRQEEAARARLARSAREAAEQALGEF